MNNENINYDKLLKLKNFYHTNINKIDRSLLNTIDKDFELKFHHSSTEIEGNTLSIFEVKTILEEGYSIGGKELREIYEVVNNKNAYDYIKVLKHQNQEITENVIKDIHEKVSQNIFQGGIYRNTNVRISGASFTPPNWENVRYLMKWFISDLRLKEIDNELNPIEISAWIHAEFVRIHPFIDGNGRTVRLLLNYSLIRYGFLPINIEAKEKSIYYETLDEYGKNPTRENLCRFVKFIETKEYKYLKEMEKEILNIKNKTKRQNFSR